MFVPVRNCYVPPSWGDVCALMSLGIPPASALRKCVVAIAVTFEVSAAAVTVALRIRPAPPLFFLPVGGRGTASSSGAASTRHSRSCTQGAAYLHRRPDGPLAGRSRAPKPTFVYGRTTTLPYCEEQPSFKISLVLFIA